MKVFLSLLVLITAFSFSTFAQLTCGSPDIHTQTYQNNPDYQQSYNRTKQLLDSLKINRYKTVVNGLNTEYHIPCVVHVIHTGGAVGSNYNPDNTAIQNFLNHINEGYANTNDVGSVPGTFNSVNTPLRFYLAQRDELTACGATTAINRIDYSSNATYLSTGVRSNTSSPGIPDEDLKNVIHWNELNYYNIYIVHRINGEDGYTTSGGFVAGYAYYPLLGGFKQDGMVVLAHQVSSNNSTFIHEFGHAFNLAHTFQDGDETNCPPNGNCSSDNDGICDTDPIKTMFTCNPSGTNPCTGLNWNVSNVQFNYMSYNGCTDRFTAGQLTAMNDIIQNVRTGYKNSAGVDAPPSTLPVSITQPTYNAGNANNNFNMGPYYVALNTIDYNSKGYTSEGSGFKHYADNTCNQSTTLIKGNTYPITVKTRLNQQNVRVYIDYDNNGTFGTAAPELVFSSNAPSSGDFTHSGNFTVPNNVQFNTPLRMRVIGDFAGATFSPTMQLQYGQAEDYTVNIIAAPLPVIWKDFSATKAGTQSVQLLWSTESEINNASFEVQHSVDGLVFNTLISISGSENKNTVSRYAYLDKQAIAGKNFYRIRQTDMDGKFTYTDIKMVNLTEEEFGVTLYPNPTLNDLTVAFQLATQDQINILVYDINGQIVGKETKTYSSGYHQFTLPTASYKPGVYFIKTSGKNGNQVSRFVKN